VARLAYRKEPVTENEIALWAAIVTHWPPVDDGELQPRRARITWRCP
jgi:hypothetical protein